MRSSMGCVARVATLLGVSAVGFFALPSTWAAGQAPTEDSATGVAYITVEQCIENPPPLPGAPPFIVCFTPDRYVFDVHSGPAGENPRGTVIFATGERAGQMSDFGVVTCLSASGNRASVGVNFRGLSVLPPPRDRPYSAVVFVEDNGGEGQDRLAVEVLPQGTTAPSVCPGSLPAGLQLGPTYPRMFTDDGSVTVTDAPNPLPTSKDQCKHGGWAQFGFKNQGQCIRFVRLIPGPPPYPSTKEQCRHGGWAQFGFRNQRRCLRFVKLRPSP